MSKKDDKSKDKSHQKKPQTVPDQNPMRRVEIKPLPKKKVFLKAHDKVEGSTSKSGKRIKRIDIKAILKKTNLEQRRNTES